jgi:DegV family protein with EDD domain
VVVDSTASLPAGLAAQHRIVVVPMTLSFGGELLRDGVDIQPDEFYRRLASGATLPKTASPSPGDFVAAFEAAAFRGARAILCLTLAKELSSTYDAARLGASQARERLPGVSIEVVDTRTAGGAEGLVALAAARAAARASTLSDVASVAARVIAQAQFIGVLDTLYYIWKGGRIPRAALWATSLLQVKPILEIRDGKVPLVERPRTRKRALERLVAIVAERSGGKPLRMIVLHGNAPQEADVLLARLRAAVRCEEAFIAPFTPVIGAHTGPGLLGVAFHPAEHDADPGKTSVLGADDPVLTKLWDNEKDAAYDRL